MGPGARYRRQSLLRRGLTNQVNNQSIRSRVEIYVRREVEKRKGKGCAWKERWLRRRAICKVCDLKKREKRRDVYMYIGSWDAIEDSSKVVQCWLDQHQSGKEKPGPDPSHSDQPTVNCSLFLASPAGPFDGAHTYMSGERTSVRMTTYTRVSTSVLESQTGRFDWQEGNSSATTELYILVWTKERSAFGTKPPSRIKTNSNEPPEIQTAPTNG